MQITCIYCGAEVVITPDRHHCRHCSGDLSSQVTPDFRASYYYQKASESAEQGAVYIALQHLHKGLQAQDRSDLHLLAAILYADLGREEQLRMHIGAIPTGDILRGEAEALLKQLYARRQATATATATQHKAPAPAATTAASHWGPRLIATVVTTGVLLSILTLTQTQQQDWLTFQGLGDFVERIRVQASQQQVFQIREPALDIVLDEVASTPVTENINIAVAEADTTDRESSESTPVLVVAEEPSLSASQWQAQVTQDVMAMISQERIDFTKVLLERGYTELQDTELVAVVQGTQLVLMGTVPSQEAKDTVVRAARQLRGVGEIDAYDVQIMVPEQIYVVQAGDNLWSIAQQLLGDGGRWREIVEYNPELTDELLRPGQDLRIPSVSLSSATLG